MTTEVTIGALKGRTLVRIEGAKMGSDRIVLEDKEGARWTFLHEQDCCESVLVDQVDGDLSDLIDRPLLLAEETTEEHEPDGEHETWTFYRFATTKGYVTIRWCGHSNGYYGEHVSLFRE